MVTGTAPGTQNVQIWVALAFIGIESLPPIAAALYAVGAGTVTERDSPVVLAF